MRHAARGRASNSALGSVKPAVQYIGFFHKNQFCGYGEIFYGDFREEGNWLNGGRNGVFHVYSD